MQKEKRVLMQINRIKEKKKALIVLLVMFAVITMLSSVKAYSLDDVQFVIPYLETDNVWNDICRNIGEFLYGVGAMFLNYAESGFTSMMNWDIMSLPIIQEVMTRFDTVLYTLLFVCFIAVVMIRMFTFQNNFKTLYNTFMTMIIISCFTIVLGLLGQVKTTLVTETDNIIKGDNNDTMAEMLYKENSVDIVQSMKKGYVVKLSDIEGIDLKRVDTSLRIKRKVLNEYYSYDEDGGQSTDTLDDGILGAGDERYYRYKIDYISINITVFLSAIVFILALFKLAYLVYQWLSINIFGKIGVGKGIWDLANIGKTLKSALNTIGGMVILYFSMLMFSMLCSNILTAPGLDNWLVKAIVIFGIGMAIVVGSGYVNDFLGIDDGSAFALKSVFMAQRLGKMGKGAVNTVRNGVGAPIKALDKGNEMLTKAENHFGGNNGNSSRNNEHYDNPQGTTYGCAIDRSKGKGKSNHFDNSKEDNERKEQFKEHYAKYDDGKKEKDLYNQSRKKDDFRDLAKGNKTGYTNQVKYRPYNQSRYDDDSDMDMQEDLDREEQMKRGKK